MYYDINALLDAIARFEEGYDVSAAIALAASDYSLSHEQRSLLAEDFAKGE